MMELGGWRTRSVFARYNVTSERDLAEALQRVSRYVSREAQRKPKVQPLLPEPAQECLERVANGEPSGGARSRTADLGIMSRVKDDEEPRD